MTDTKSNLECANNALFEKWWNSDTMIEGTYDGKEIGTPLFWAHQGWLASSQVAQGRIDELEAAVKLVYARFSDAVAEITALEARNRELESTLKEIETSCYRWINEPNTEKGYDRIKYSAITANQALLSTQPTDALDKKEVK
jgi:hypothetical protein